MKRFVFMCMAIFSLLSASGNLLSFYPSKVKPAGEEITGILSR